MKFYIEFGAVGGGWEVEAETREQAVEIAKQRAKEALEHGFSKGDYGVSKLAEPNPDMPDGVFQGADGFYYEKQGEKSVRVCEDCWKPIPRYVDFPQGLTSPESDGDAGGNFAKVRMIPIPESDKRGVEHLQKAVCLPCYLLAFNRVYPNAELPEFRDKVIGGIEQYAPDYIPPLEYVPEPKSV